VPVPAVERSFGFDIVEPAREIALVAGGKFGTGPLFGEEEVIQQRRAVEDGVQPASVIDCPVEGAGKVPVAGWRQIATSGRAAWCRRIHASIDPLVDASSRSRR